MLIQQHGPASKLTCAYAEDAYVLPSDADIVKGRAAIEAFRKQAVGQFGDARLTTIDVAPLGRTAAREIGTVTLKTKAPRASVRCG